MTEIVKTLEPVFQKIADFFNLFDLSFIVSGVVTSSALVFFLHSTGQIDIYEIHMKGFMFFIGVVVIYAIGLVSWVIGRYLRGFYPRYIHVQNKFVDHSATDDILYKKYLPEGEKDLKKVEKNMKVLYGYMWVIVREKFSDKESYSILKRYWVQTATFDGLVSSFFLWALVFVSVLFITPVKNLTLTQQGHPINSVLGYIALAISIISMLAVRSEAIRYKKYQIGELVDTYIKSQRNS